LLPSGVRGGKSPGTDDGNGDGRGAIGVTAGPGAVIGRGAAVDARGGSLVLACRRFALRAVFFAGRRLAVFLTVFRLRAGAAPFRRLTAFFFDFRFFAMSLLR
jgi:hypothetical protein